MKKLRISFLALIFISANVLSEDLVSNDWIWDVSGQGYYYAATINSNNRVLGQYCYHQSKTCLYVVTLGMNCKEGDEFPAILNSNFSVASVNLQCGRKVGIENILIIYPFDEVNQILLRANNASFAIPLHDGSFKAIKFSLSGSSKAIKMMRAAAIARSNDTDSLKPIQDDEVYL